MHLHDETTNATCQELVEGLCRGDEAAIEELKRRGGLSYIKRTINDDCPSLDVADIIIMAPPGWTVDLPEEDGHPSRLFLNLHLSEEQKAFTRTAIANGWSIVTEEPGFITLVSP